MRKILVVGWIAAIVAAAPRESACQSATSVAVGPNYVFGATSEWSGPGYNVQAGREFGHLGPAVFRADGLYMQRSGNGRTLSSLTGRTYALSGAIVLRRSIGRVAPYTLVGVGLYGDNSWAVYTPGINAGIGMDVAFAHMRLFAESRIHQYLRDARNAPVAARGVTQVPISFGFRF
jgi:hypothetical protein